MIWLLGSILFEVTYPEIQTIPTAWDFCDFYFFSNFYALQMFSYSIYNARSNTLNSISIISIIIFILMRKLLLKSILSLHFCEDLLLFELICSTCQVFVCYVCEGDKRTQKSKKMKISFMYEERMFQVWKCVLTFVCCYIWIF